MKGISLFFLLAVAFTASFASDKNVPSGVVSRNLEVGTNLQVLFEYLNKRADKDDDKPKESAPKKTNNAEEIFTRNTRTTQANNQKTEATRDTRTTQATRVAPTTQATKPAPTKQATEEQQTQPSKTQTQEDKTTKNNPSSKTEETKPKENKPDDDKPEVAKPSNKPDDDKPAMPKSSTEKPKEDIPKPKTQGGDESKILDMPKIDDSPPQQQEEHKTYTYDVKIPDGGKSNPFIYHSKLPDNLVFIIVAAILGFILVSFAGVGLVVSIAAKRLAKKEKGIFHNDSNSSFPDTFYYGSSFSPSQYGSSSDTRVGTNDEISFSQGRTYRDTLFGHNGLGNNCPSISGATASVVGTLERKTDNRRTMFISPTMEYAKNRKTSVPSYYKGSMDKFSDNASSASLILKSNASGQYYPPSTVGARNSSYPDQYGMPDMMSEVNEPPMSYEEFVQYAPDRLGDEGYDRVKRPPSHYLNNLLQK